MTAVETVFDLAQCELERREADGKAHRTERLAIAQFAEQFRDHLPDRPIPLRGHGLAITASMLAAVDATPSVSRIVATFNSNNAAYQHRLKWRKLGYQVWTQKLRPGCHAVLVKKSG